jgi:hypothetical protein
VPAGWDDTQDRGYARECIGEPGYARECIGEPEKEQTWHQHCLEHVNQQMAELHQGLDRIIRHLAPEVAKDDLLLETLTAEDKLIAVRKLVAAHATELLAKEQAQLRPGGSMTFIARRTRPWICASRRWPCAAGC